MKRRSIVAANWKMNGSSALVQEMMTALNSQNFGDSLDVVICPPYPFLSDVNKQTDNSAIYLGAQNISEQNAGAYTGEVSAAILQEFDTKYVIIGHSERRSLYSENSDLVATKVAVALESGLIPILCIGESELEREQGNTEQVLTEQLTPVINLLGIDKFESVVIAYEPVWAIGTGKTASPEMAQETHHFIRQFLAGFNAVIAAKVPLLYGGSVNAGNCEKLFAEADIDGGLIGGASLKAQDFITICSAAKG